MDFRNLNIPALVGLTLVTAGVWGIAGWPAASIVAGSVILYTAIRS